MVRNKATNFPPRISFNGEPRAKPAFSSKRANGEINTRPQERMRNSNIDPSGE